jgi:signal transduction histidine kinase
MTESGELFQGPGTGAGSGLTAPARGEGPRLAWLPIPVALAAMVAFRVTDLHSDFQAPRLLMGVDFLCRTVACLLVVYLAGRSFLARGEPGLLLLGCGVFLWGATGFLATSTLTHRDANLGVTISNIGIWLAGVCHLVGVVLSLRSGRTVRPAGLWLACGALLSLGFVTIIALLTFAHRLPVFFVEGQGGMPVRHMVLGSALAMFALSAVLLREGNLGPSSSFAYWYALALLLIAIAIGGMLLQSSRDSLLNWSCRAVQYLGGIYMFVAALASRRESGVRGIALGHAMNATRFRYGVAVAIVLAAAALRLAFMSSFEGRVPFAIFYPAVVLAALYGGLRAGLLATALSAILVAFFWMEPVGSFSVGQPVDWLALGIFFVSALMISLVTGAMQRAQARVHEAEAQVRMAAVRQRDLEALRRTADELARSNKDLEQFAYVASHDLQEPLRQVRAFVDLLREQHGDKLGGKAGEYLQFVYDGAARMRELVQGLLAYSRAGSPEDGRQSVDCRQALDTAVANLQLSIGEAGARITHDDLPAVQAEPTQLAQLFQNLVGNALKFRRDGVAPEIHVGACRDGNRWILSVKDNGIGIDPAHHEKVFLIFQRLHGREKYPGTGIGLAVCKKIVERHGGKIWIESKVGQGSTFYFTLEDGGA